MFGFTCCEKRVCRRRAVLKASLGAPPPRAGAPLEIVAVLHGKRNVKRFSSND